MPTFSIKESIRFGWTTFKARPWLFIGTEVLLFAISFLTQLPAQASEHMSGVAAVTLGILAFGLSSVVSFLIDMGKTAFYLKAHDSVETTAVQDLWHPRPFFAYLAVSVMAGLATLIGLLLLIVPGIIVGIMVAFATYIVIDKQMGPIEAIKHSIELTKGHRWHLFRFGLALLALNILGLLALIVGILVTIPISILAVVHVYRALSTTSAPKEEVALPAVA